MSNLGLVANYGSSDSESENDIESENSVTQNRVLGSIVRKDDSDLSSRSNNTESAGTTSDHSTLPILPKKCETVVLANPLRNEKVSIMNPNSSSSVFYNPFRREQEVKKSDLEMHVKLTTNPKDVVEINGRKICWNYRKGRCKFGHNCKYAHDSDLIVNSEKKSKKSRKTSSDSSLYGFGEEGIDILDSQLETQEFRKRKPGLSEGLIPNKRSRMMYKECYTKKSPWLNKR